MVRRRLLWALALGVPLGACAAIVVATGAFVGTTFLQVTSFDVRCHDGSGPPLLPAPCGGAAARAVPYVVAGLALASLTPYVVLLRRWVRDAAPPPRSPSVFLGLLRVLTGCGIGVLLCASSVAGWTWLANALNEQVLHMGCYAVREEASGATSEICGGHLYFGIPPLTILLTLALCLAYPVLWFVTDRPAEPQDVEVGR